MRKKALNVILFLAVVIAAVGMTLYVGRGAASILVYNFCFLGIMVIAYAVGMFGGMFRMNDLSRAFRDAADELKDIFQSPGKIDTRKLSSLNGIFHHRYLDDKMQAFTDTISQSQEGIGDIEEYLNEEDVDEHIHKRLLEMVPDIFTSLGILGTFVGLANNIYRDAYRACHILPGDLPLHQHRQTLPGHVHAVAHLIPGIPEAVQSGQFYEIRITDADQIAAFALIVLRCQRCSSLYTIPFIFHRYFSATVSHSK